MELRREAGRVVCLAADFCRFGMIRYLAAGAKHVFGWHRPGRRLPVQPDDILLASYPHSGDVWTQFLIANLIHPDGDVTSSNVQKLVLDFDLSVKRDFDRAPQPRIIQSHSSFDPRYRRVIYVTRDPRDVAVASCNSLGREPGAESHWDDFIGRFLARGDGASPVSTDDFGSWGENAGSWLAARSHDPGFLLLRHEDLLADTGREVMRLAKFAGLAASPEKIAQAIDRSSSHTPLKANWRNDLPDAQVARIEAAWGDIMACLGYELVTRNSRSVLDSSLIGLLAAGAAR
jgi:Sulfotransferase domain